MNNKKQPSEDIQLWQQATKILDQLYQLNLADSLSRIERMQLNPELESRVQQLLHAREQHNTLLTAPEGVFIDHFQQIDLSGHILGDFRLIKLLARGGMSAVYRGRKISADAQKDVAIKVMPPQIMGEQSRQLFAQELTTLSKLHHPHIVDLHHGSISDTEIPYLQMELIEDALTINDYVVDNDLSQQAMIQLFITLCQTLEYAHLNGIIHRDIKPNNVLVDSFGQIKVIDFGIAAMVQKPDAPVAYTRTYAAPEQILKAPTTEATDVYSICLLLLECLQPSIDIKQLREQRDSITDSVSNLAVDKDLKTLLNTGLQGDPEKRYATMALLRQDLELYLDKKPLHSVSYSPFRKLWKSIQRQPIISALSILLLVSFGVGSTVSFLQMKKAQTEQAKAVQVKDFLINSIRQTDPDIALGRETTVKEMLINASLLANSESIQDQQLATEINQVIGSAFIRIGEYSNSIKPLQRANFLTPAQPQTLIPLATAHLQLNQNTQAQRLIEELKILSLNAEQNIQKQLLEARMFTLNGNFPQAEQIYQQAIETATNLNLPELVTTAQTQLSAYYSINDQNDKAVEMLRLALDQSKQRYGDENTHTLKIMSELTMAMQSSDSATIEESITLFEQLIPLQRKILGDLHPQLAQSLMLKAAASKTFGQIETAMQDAQEALTIARHNFGDNHLLSARVHINLGQIKLAQGDLAAAIEDISTGLKSYEYHLGADHYETLQHKTSLTALMLRNQQFEQALQLATQIHATQKQQLGEQHRATLYAQIVIAKALIGLQRYDEAIATADDCYTKSTSENQGTHILKVGCGLALEEALYETGEHDRALELASRYLDEPLVQANPAKVQILKEHISNMQQP
ncbi:protein kinase [Marinicella sp. W31]|uniref:protein kinase domain-containing protein n=1 Tax=Marinicella sp. W31 TaxID=3023713 RepID=UPI0037577C57